MNVILTKADRSQEPILQNLMQLYTHDFSEFWGGTTRGDLLSDGRFDAYPMKEYWTNPAWSASLIRCDDALAGMVLVNDHAHSGTSVDRNMAEFFVLRKYRGCGVGRAAAAIAFSERPGSWEIAVARKNVAALSFWRRIVGSLVEVKDLHEIDVHNERWNGPILRFAWSRP